MSYFAAALARTGENWTGVEVDLDEVEDIEALTDLLRDLTGEAPGPALLMLEEDDEYVAIVRVDGGATGLAEPRVFLSDRRAVQGSDVAAMLWEEADPEDDEDDEDDEDEGTRPVVEPVGDTELLADLGTTGADLVDLCAEEGLLPADVLTTVCERAGCADVLEELREG
ncbi:MAG: tRNA adenosine deaminase-associated protein [Frankiaceae bacterium]|nr:tRNA adenosine deaminase-associated protein [Frankiaceae bacterium]